MLKHLNYNELNRFIDKERKAERLFKYWTDTKWCNIKNGAYRFQYLFLQLLLLLYPQLKEEEEWELILAFGIIIAMVYVFFDKIFGVMAEQSDFSPIIAVWFPNVSIWYISNISCYIMPNAKSKNYLHLHFLVFIAGFTAILGELISIGSIPLVWYRMLIAGLINVCVY